MLQDMTPRAALKGPRVVMANGDVLPGQNRGIPAGSRKQDDTPARLLIALDGSLVTADPRGLVVRADRVLRVTTAAGPTTDGRARIAGARRWDAG